MKITKYILPVLIAILSLSCNSNKLEETPIEKFEGTWKLEGRAMFNGIEIKIEKNEKGILKGKITKLNDNKFIQMFAEEGDIWITDISRSSNFEFRLTEKKIGGPLFSLYGLDTSKEYKVQFTNDDTIGLGSDDSDPFESAVRYVRVK